MKNFPFDEDQTKAILDIKLSRLAKLEVSKLIQEKKEKEELVDFCKEVISFREKRVEILVSRLKHLVEVYGDSRRTEINSKEVVSSTAKKTRSKAKFEPQSVICVVNAMGYLKVIPAGRYRARADKKNLLESKTQNDDMLEIFTDKGKMYRIVLKNIKMCEASDKGLALGSILEFAGNEKILFANLENNPKVCDTLLFVTKKGYVKRTDPCQYCGSTQNVKGVKAIAFKAEEDEVVCIAPISEFDGITLKTETNSIHFCAESIRVMGKAAGGVKGINTDNEVVSVSIGTFNKQKSQKPGGKGRKE
jgi:DNA gyrase subunit A